MQGKACPVLESREEIVIDFRLLIAAHDSQQRKGSVLITVSLPVEQEFDLLRRWVMRLGHSPPSSSFSACKSSIGLTSQYSSSSFSLFYFQNCDMGPQYHRVRNCGWCMVRWPSIEHTGYVSHPLLFAPSSHVSWLCS